jgi:hypothetical protein
LYYSTSKLYPLLFYVLLLQCRLLSWLYPFKFTFEKEKKITAIITLFTLWKSLSGLSNCMFYVSVAFGGLLHDRVHKFYMSWNYIVLSLYHYMQIS